jgi:peptidoglycan/xylan/chitin deacetylase (PgdA/CDA1 family)
MLSETTRSATDSRANSFASDRSAWKESCARFLASGLHYSGLLRMLRPFEANQRLESQPNRFPRFRPFKGSKFGILCYHRIGTEGVPLYSRLDSRTFEEQMRYIRRRYRIVSLDQLCRELSNHDVVPPTLAVTFDDGYRDLYRYAFPVLQKWQIPATIYLIARCMETGEAPWYDRIFAALQAFPEASLELDLHSPRTFELHSREARLRAALEIISYLRTIPDSQRRNWCARFEARVPTPGAELQERMLNWEQVRAMHRAGVFFGAHTGTHPFVSRLEPELLEDELGRSRQILQHGLQAEVRDFAYPFGKPEDCNLAAEEFLPANGYRSAVTTIERCNTADTNPYRLCRLSVNDESSLAYFAFRVSRMFLDCVPETEQADFSSVQAHGMKSMEAEPSVGAKHA